MINHKSLNDKFDNFIERINDKEIKKLWVEHSGIKKKFFDFIYNDIVNIDKPNILEFGVRHGLTALFLDIKIKTMDNTYILSISTIILISLKMKGGSLYVQKIMI